jgi:hypothetical protein
MPDHGVCCVIAAQQERASSPKTSTRGHKNTGTQSRTPMIFQRLSASRPQLPAGFKSHQRLRLSEPLCLRGKLHVRAVKCAVFNYLRGLRGGDANWRSGSPQKNKAGGFGQQYWRCHTGSGARMRKRARVNVGC